MIDLDGTDNKARFGANAILGTSLAILDISSSIAPAQNLDPQAHALYVQHCLACHQIDGSGVPNMLPSLIHSKRLSGNDNEHIARLVLEGSAWIENRQYPNLMANYSFLSNQDISLVLNYVKARFGQSTDIIGPDEIGAIRRRLNSK